MADTVPLSELPITLLQMTGVQTGYQTWWRKVRDGHLTAQKTASGRLMIRREDVETIAAKLTHGE